MERLKLHLETLQVESFTSSPANREYGTVQGYVAWTRPVNNTCQLNCGTTVQYTVCNTNPCM
jgi:hypothetical protein